MLSHAWDLQLRLQAQLGVAPDKRSRIARRWRAICSTANICFCFVLVLFCVALFCFIFLPPLLSCLLAVTQQRSWWTARSICTRTFRMWPHIPHPMLSTAPTCECLLLPMIRMIYCSSYATLVVSCPSCITSLRQ